MVENLTEKTTCEVCGATCLLPVLNLGLHPMCDDLVRIGETRSCREYPIEIGYCKVCHTAHQRFQIPKQELFPKTYHYRSRFTADVLNGMASLVESCADRFGSLSNKRVVDIGCNDGSLLTFFKKKGAITIGIEPTDAVKDAQALGHAAYNGFLSPSLAAEVRAAHGVPDFIVFTNVFAHIENLPEVIRSLKLLSGGNTTIIIENHYLGAVLNGNQFDTFYHEHPRTYSLASFAHIAKSLKASLVDAEFPSRYGGNIRVFLGPCAAAESSDKFAEISRREDRFPEQFQILARNIEHWRTSKRAFIEEHVRRNGKLRAKAFPGRAAILVKLLTLDADIIERVYEKPGSMKIGHYVPGTRIPIHSDDELFAMPDQSRPILNLAWHISDEIRRYLKQNRYQGEVLDIIDSLDFNSGR